jgi:hypothetical protein
MGRCGAVVVISDPNYRVATFLLSVAPPHTGVGSSSGASRVVQGVRSKVSKQVVRTMT